MGSSEGQRHKNKNPEKKVKKGNLSNFQLNITFKFLGLLWISTQVTVLLKRVREDYWEPIAKSVGPILASAVVIIISWIVYFKIQLCNNETRLNSTGNTDHDRLTDWIHVSRFIIDPHQTRFVVLFHQFDHFQWDESKWWGNDSGGEWTHL